MVIDGGASSGRGSREAESRCGGVLKEYKARPGRDRRENARPWLGPGPPGHSGRWRTCHVGGCTSRRAQRLPSHHIDGRWVGWDGRGLDGVAWRRPRSRKGEGIDSKDSQLYSQEYFQSTRTVL